MLSEKLLRKECHVFPEVSNEWGKVVQITNSQHLEKIPTLLSFFDRILYKWGGTTFCLEAESPLPCNRYVLYITGFRHWLEIKCYVDFSFCYSRIVVPLFDSLISILHAKDFINFDSLKSEMSSNLAADYCVHLLRELAFNEIYCEEMSSPETRQGIANSFWIRSGAEMTVKLSNLHFSEEPCPIKTELSFPQSVLPAEHVLGTETMDHVVKMLKETETPEKQPLQYIKTDSDNLDDAVSIRLFQEEGYSLPLHLSACPKRPIQVFKTTNCPAYWNSTIKFFFDDLCIFLDADMQIEIPLTFLRNPAGSLTGDLGYVVRLSMSRWEWLVVYTDQPRIESYMNRVHLREQLYAFEMLMMANAYENILKRLDVPENLQPSLEVVDRSVINKLAKFVAKISKHLKQAKWFRSAVDRGESVWDCQEMPETLKFFWRCIHEDGDVSLERLLLRQREMQEKAMRKMRLLANRLGVDCDVMMSMREQPREEVAVREKAVREKVVREKVVRERVSVESSPASEGTPRKRGRPPKRRLFTEDSDDVTEESTDVVESSNDSSIYKRRMA